MHQIRFIGFVYISMIGKGALSRFFVSKGCSSQQQQETSTTGVKAKDACVRPPKSAQDDTSLAEKLYERDQILKVCSFFHNLVTRV